LRDLPLQQGLDEIGAEQIAQAIHFSTVALLEGQLESSRAELERSLKAEEIPPPPPPPRPSTPAPPPEPERTLAPTPPTPAVEFSPGIGYGLAYRGETEGFGHGPRASLSLLLSRRWLLGARLATTLPLERSVGPIDLELYGGSLTLTAGFQRRFGPAFALQVFAGPGLELINYASSPTEKSGLDAGRAETDPRPHLSGALAAVFGQEPRLALVLEAALALRDTHYDVLFAGGSAEIGRPAWVMPGLSLELGL
jgi:hypothetical protein